MMKAAMEGAFRSDGSKPLVIAVTQLTSTSEERMNRELLIQATMEETVLHYAQNAKEAGLAGIVCSPLEAAIVKKGLGEDFITVTPGIRLPDSIKDDQARITTPAQAREIGTDYIVVGRPIIRAENPVAAYDRFCHDFLGEA